MQYIIRLDDACPTMASCRWRAVLEILNDYCVKAIIGVVPYNMDPKLIVDDYDNMFWDKIRDFQSIGHIIALHGCHHLLRQSGRGVIGLHNRSEFVDMSLAEQVVLISKGWNKFLVENITSRVWIAPAHGFDANTLTALKAITNIDIISDGMALYPYNKDGFFWIPQLLWRGKKMFAGVHTICLHPNKMSDVDIVNLKQFIKVNLNKFIFNIDELTFKYNNRSFGFVDELFSFLCKKYRVYKK